VPQTVRGPFPPAGSVHACACNHCRVSVIDVTHFTDPGCPFAYSASPALAVLRWRYGRQLQWRLVTIGLAEDPQRYIDAGYTPTRSTLGQHGYFKGFGMPLLMAPRDRVTATSRACRAIVATRLLASGREEAALRALQLAWFTTTLLLDEDADIAKALARVDGLDVEAIVAAIDDERTIAAYEQDKRETREAEGGPTDFQGKARQTDGPVRYSAPSLVFESASSPEGEAGRRLEAGGFQTIEAYDVLIANLDPKLERQAPPEEPLAALRSNPTGLVTQEVAAIMAQNNQRPDRAAAERALIELLGAGSVRREPLADDALWLAA
jgi:2-hydroxychromene-2-carboxylate isomerase